MRWIWMMAAMGCGSGAASLDGRTGDSGDSGYGGPVVDGSGVPTTSTLDPHGDDDDSDEADEMNGFSWVDEGLAGMPRPYRDDFAFLAEQQIALLVGLRLTPESDEVLQEHGLEYLHLPIEDFHPPTHEQQVAFVQAVEQRLSAGEKVGVHCTAGLGRTGTMLATWFVHQGMGPHEAIAHVRSERPGSIETVEQEEAVVRFADATR